MGLFGSSKKASPTPSVSSTEAIQKMRTTLDILSKKEAHLESRMQQENSAALACASSNRSAALLALHRKKLLAKHRDQTRAARFNLELQLMAIENATLNLETMEAMRQGSLAIKALHGAVSVERVDETMEEIREQMEVAQEISEAIASPLGAGGLGIVVDEDELDAELEALQQEQLDKALLATPPVPTTSMAAAAAKPVSTPVSPRQQVKPSQESEDDERELERLRQKMLAE
jgi:charged multivesicular body protein 4